MPESEYFLTGILNEFNFYIFSIMKSMQTILISILLASITLVMNAQDKSKKTETVKYATSIDCENCVKKIMTNLPFEKGIRDVKCDLASKEVTVTYQKDKNDPEKIKRAIEKLGYTALQVADTTRLKK